VRLVVFSIERQRYALDLSSVDRTLRASKITPLPNAPDVVLGIINVEGRVLPVMNLRVRFGLGPREMRLSDVLILARTPKWTVALAADAVEGLIEHTTENVQSAASIFPDVPYLQGVAKLDDGLVLIHDLASFLSLHEEMELDAAMTSTRSLS
jgi:purine-binding chemotaxis protein CheW